jgi:hypothetical protein
MIDYEYLKGLIKQVESLRKQIEFCEFDITKCSFSYMPTKKTSFVGYKEGCFDHMIRNKKGMKISDKIRANTKSYHRLIKNEAGELIRIETYNKGSLDCIFQVHWIENTRYLFPFLYIKEPNPRYIHYPTYVYVTRFENEAVVEEYMVDGNHIVYELYSYKSNNQVEFSSVNYVPSGSYPIMEERKGVFKLEPLTYDETYYDCWLNHREK